MQKKIIRFILYILVFAWIVYHFGVPKYKTINSKEDSESLYKAIENDTINWLKIGYSTKGRNIYLLDIGDSNKLTLIIGNIHGNEFGSFNLCLKFARYIYSHSNLISKRVIIIPTINPDGMYTDTRKNSNNVDLNRNFPSQDWTPVYSNDEFYPGSNPASESETKIILNLFKIYKPEKVISIHSNQHLIEYAGPAKGLANVISRINNYKVTEYKGSGTPGSLDTYTGIDLGIKTITLELPNYDPEQAWIDNKDALIAAINF
jgi:murein peptide amidase A